MHQPDAAQPPRDPIVQRLRPFRERCGAFEREERRDLALRDAAARRGIRRRFGNRREHTPIGIFQVARARSARRHARGHEQRQHYAHDARSHQLVRLKLTTPTRKRRALVPKLIRQIDVQIDDRYRVRCRLGPTRRQATEQRHHQRRG